MKKEFWTVEEIEELLQIEEAFIVNLEEEGIVCPTCRERPPTKVFTPGEMEKLRLSKILVEDMGINLAGVEVILRMRRCMMDMRKQFDAILEALAEDLQEPVKKIR